MRRWLENPELSGAVPGLATFGSETFGYLINYQLTNTDCQHISILSPRGAAEARLATNQEVAGSNPAGETKPGL